MDILATIKREERKLEKQVTRSYSSAQPRAESCLVWRRRWSS
jgi:hypothetical protein